jgi:2-polyprenyl-3-methyl-5-hydroxy-6-metoxy-1,4-benzoquinol methylase
MNMPLNIPENTSKNTHNVVESLVLSDHPSKVLDIPSGAGAFTNRLLQKSIEVHSADIENLLMVENENYVQADMNKKLPFDNDFFDSVVCIDGIEHLENPFSFIREANRITNKSGTILISTPNINSLRSRWRWLWTSHHNKCKSPLNEHKQSYLHHINMMSYQRLRYILHTNGFRIEKVMANRSKLISKLYFPLIPFTWLNTFFVYRKEEKEANQIESNREIINELHRPPLLFGETMIVKARKL